MTSSSLLPTLPSGSRLLVVRLRSLGDIVLLTPSLRMLKDWRPDLRLSVLVEDRFKDVLAGNPCVDEVLVLRKSRGVAKTWELLRMIKELRARRFGLCVNLHGGPTSAHLARLSGARWNAGFFNFRSQGVYDFSIPNAHSIFARTDVHTAEHQAAPFFWLGLPARPVPASEVSVTEAGRTSWQEKLTQCKLPPGCDYALLHPPALYPTKQWPAQRFAALGQWLEQEAGISVIYSAGPGELGCLDEVERAAGAPIRRLDSLRLEIFLAAIAGAKLFVGNDSGPAHLAAALGCPLVVIFGSSNSVIWRPWQGASCGGEPPPAKAAFRVVQNSFDCNPCPGDRCYRFEQPECILSVTFDQVRAAVEAVIHQQATDESLGLKDE